MIQAFVIHVDASQILRLVVERGEVEEGKSEFLGFPLSDPLRQLQPHQHFALPLLQSFSFHHLEIPPQHHLLSSPLLEDPHHFVLLPQLPEQRHPPTIPPLPPLTQDHSYQIVEIGHAQKVAVLFLHKFEEQFPLLGLASYVPAKGLQFQPLDRPPQELGCQHLHSPVVELLRLPLDQLDVALCEFVVGGGQAEVCRGADVVGRNQGVLLGRADSGHDLHGWQSDVLPAKFLPRLLESPPFRGQVRGESVELLQVVDQYEALLAVYLFLGPG